MPHKHGHGHKHEHGHDHGHDGHKHNHGQRLDVENERVLVIRPNSGLAGDIMAAGLLALSRNGEEELASALACLGLEQLNGRVRLISREVNQITGAGLEVDLPDEHEHRKLKDIEDHFAAAGIDDRARLLALKTFRLLAEAEAAAHNRRPEEVHFHEVGALDSIMDIGLVSVLISRLGPDRVVCGPLPVCDGVINCAHGLLPSPAPAVLRLLEGMPVVGLASRGETITPTAAALLKALEVEFGPWPSILIESQSLAYGSRVLEGVPNGAVFALGRAHSLGRR